MRGLVAGMINHGLSDFLSFTVMTITRLFKGRALKIFAISAVFGPAVVFLFASAEWWIQNVMIGDATAYSIVASNIAKGAGSTYDGLTSTNGYHPLWLLMHVPLMLGAEAPLDRLFLSKVLVVITTVAAAFVWMNVIKTYLQNKISGWLMLAWAGGSGWSIFVLYSGLETPLVVLMIGVCLLYSRSLLKGDFENNTPYSLWPVIRLGLAMGLCFLARLDSIFFLMLLSLLLLPNLLRSGIRNTAAWAISGLAVVVPYMLINVSQFGSIMPVSGIVKENENVDIVRSVNVLYSRFEDVSKLLPPSFESLFPLFAIAVALLGLFVVFWLFFRIPKWGKLNPLVLVPLSAVLQLGYYFLFINELLIAWHIYLQVLTFFILLAALPTVLPGRNSEKRQKLLASIVLVTLVVSSYGYSVMKSFRRSDRELSYVAVDWIEKLPKGNRLAMYDGWFVQLLAGPDYHILDLSGLVTDRETALKAKVRDYDSLLDNHDIEYVLGWEKLVNNLKSVKIKERDEVPWNHEIRTFVLGRRVLQEAKELADEPQ
jgi:hypothetical protein